MAIIFPSVFALDFVKSTGVCVCVCVSVSARVCVRVRVSAGARVRVRVTGRPCTLCPVAQFCW